MLGLGLVVGWTGAELAAQDDGVQTLHVYTNLIQIPVLVLSLFRLPMKKIASDRFMVSVDSGPRFRATHVRPEGDDPISLSILLDARGREDDVLTKIDQEIAALAPLSLQARDRVTIYALDCSLIHTLNEAPTDREGLKRAVNAALQSWRYRKENKHASSCKSALQLWDAMRFVIEELSHLSGRRVLLAITDGNDKGSRHTWNEVRMFAGTTGVAVFGIVYAPYSFDPDRNLNREDAFNSVCELSGGMIFKTDGRDMTPTLKRFVKTVRERYIVEFPRPSNSTAGQHDLQVSIEKMDAFIRPAGVSVPIPDPALLADPTTVPADPSRAPVEGTRRVLTKPQ